MLLFCVEDMELCCLVCRDSIQHRNHRLYPIPEAAALMKKPIVTHSSRVTQIVERLDGYVQEQVEMIDRHKVEKLYLSHNITNEFEKLHKFLNIREKELQTQLDIQGSAILLEMEQNLERLQAQVNDFRQSKVKCEERIKEPDPIQVLQGFKDFNSRFCNRRQQRHNLNVVKKALCRGQFKGPFQYHAWKAMLPIIQTVPSSAKLDPSSAHMDLIFPDQFSVAYKKQLNLFRTPSPSRFSHYFMTLTDEGITEGKHYWEVDVANKKIWFTGLASENVNRKQSDDPSIKDGYWAICCYHGAGLNVLDKPLVPLQGRTPSRVGIYLDYHEGQVSFYDALTMVHLHSFKENFTDKLYLYLAPGWVDETPMRIVCPQL
uniref:B30.2/SPRY domain-containing protein n=1 Tax=Leptobrachium leishanense TaxID=445787 RepID=A0A8C5QGK6_9ANUR